MYFFCTSTCTCSKEKSFCLAQLRFGPEFFLCGKNLFVHEGFFSLIGTRNLTNEVKFFPMYLLKPRENLFMHELSDFERYG